jgi:hypothetical protein
MMAERLLNIGVGFLTEVLLARYLDRNNSAFSPMRFR